MNILLQSFRSLRRSPGATLVSLMVLTLGIGAATALFSLYNTLVLRPMEVPRAAQWRSFQVDFGDRYGLRGLNMPLWNDLKAAGPVVEQVALEKRQSVRVQAGEETLSVPGVWTDPAYFQALGVQPLVGAGYGEDQPGAVLHVSLWRKLFGDLRTLEGCRIQVNGTWMPVLGVAPEAFRGFHPFETPGLWVFGTLASGKESAPEEALPDVDYKAYVRLRSGITDAQAIAALHPRVAGWRFPDLDLQGRPSLQALGESRASQWTTFLPQSKLLWLAIGLLLSLSCLNVAQLQAARAFQRRRESSTRLALGADLRHLVSMVVLEMLVLTSLGTLLSLPVASFIARGLARFAPATMGLYQLDPKLDGRVVLFALGLLLVMILILATATLWRVLRCDPMDGLREGTGGLGRFTGVHRVLLGLQLALALALLWNACAVLSGLRRTLAKPLGFNPEGVAVVSLEMPAGASQKARMNLLMEMRRRAMGLPGVQNVAIGATSPLDPLKLRFGIPGEDGSPDYNFDANLVGLDYFNTLKIPLIEGRELAPEDQARAGRVVILNRSLARQCFPEGGSVVGRNFAGMEVIGVVEDHVQSDLECQPRGFIPLERVGFNWQCLIVRSSLSRSALATAMERTIAQVDPRWPIIKIESLPEKLTRQQQPQRLASVLLSGLGVLAAVLAFAGIFGLQSHLTAQRTREAGLRIALGATPASVALTFSRAVLLPTAIGLSGGAVMVLTGHRLLTRLLGALGHVDAISLLFSACALGITAFAAAWIPSLRASQVPPAMSLRSE